MKPEFFRLKLIHPLFYGPDTEISVKSENPRQQEMPVLLLPGEHEERIFRFLLDESAAGQFEPDRGAFPGALVFAGRASSGTRVKGDSQTPPVELAAGNYLFTQTRELLASDAVLDLAIETQQEALWQRLLPAPDWYIRVLFEDGSPVTQILRPYTE